jgi:hypothetical protein
MPRKRQPFTFAGVSVELEAPGLEARNRGDRTEYYWVASKDARARGFLPRTVRFHDDMSNYADAVRVARRCRELDAEMTDWLADPDGQRIQIYDGTLTSLIGCYQRDPESSYRSNTQGTRACYDDWCRTLIAVAGTRRVDRLTGRDLRKWFLAIMRPAAPGAAPRLRLARGCVRQMMPILLAYGAEIKLPGCLDLAEVLERMTLRVPRQTRIEWKAARPRKIAMTYEQASAIVDEGLRRGTKRHRSVALGVAAQFEFTLRQIDVIGWWERPEGNIAIKPCAIEPCAIKPCAIAKTAITKPAITKPGRSGSRIWRAGLTFEQLAGGTLDLTTSKTTTDAAFAVGAYPLFVRALEAVPPADRRGPLVVDESGAPVQRRYYRELYVEVARRAGVPKGVWNMWARHGGVTEAHDAGADLVDIGKHAQHSNPATTNRHYIVPTIETTRRVAAKRVAHRAANLKKAP